MKECGICEKGVLVFQRPVGSVDLTINVQFWRWKKVDGRLGSEDGVLNLLGLTKTGSDGRLP